MPKNYDAPAVSRPSASLLFTDRDEERGLLKRFFAAIQAGGVVGKPVLHFYGVGGVGKTTLLAKATEEWRTEHPKSPLLVACLSVDSNDWNKESSVTDFFVHLRAVMGREGVSAPLFDALHFCHWAKQHPGENCTLKNSPFSDLLSRVHSHGDFLAAACDQVGGLLAGFNPVTAIDKILGKWRESGGLKAFTGMFGKSPAEMSLKDLSDHMPRALATDVRNFLLKNPTSSLCLALDGFERVQSDSASRNDTQKAFQEFVARLVLPPTLRLGFIVLGREMMRWGELFDEPTSPPDEQWPAFTDSHLLGGLSRNDACRFLDSAVRQISDERVKRILQAYREDILMASGDGTPDSACYPYYLDLALDLIWRHPGDFQPEMLGHKSAELEERFLRYLTPGEKRTLQALALADSFDEALFRDLVARKVIQEYAATDFPAIVGPARSYVNPVNTKPGWYAFHRHMRDALVKSLSRMDEDKQIATRIVREILDSIEKRFKVDKLADFTSDHFAVYSQAFRILFTHAATNSFLSPDFVSKRFFDWDRLLGDRFYASDRCGLIEPFMRYFQEKLGPEHHDTLRSLNNLATLLYFKGDRANAEQLFLQVLEARKRILGDEHPDTLKSLHSLSTLLQAKGALGEAEKLYRQVIDGQKRTLGEEHPSTLASLNNLANLLFSKDDLAIAEKLYRQAIDAQKRTLGEEHPNTLASRSNFARVLKAKGDLAGAEQLYRQVIEAQLRTLGENHPDTLTSRSNLAKLLYSNDDLAGAEPLYRQAFEARKRTLGEDHPDTLDSLHDLSNLLYHKSDRTGAEHLYREALTIMQKLETRGDLHSSLRSMFELLRETFGNRPSGD